MLLFRSERSTMLLFACFLLLLIRGLLPVKAQTEFAETVRKTIITEKAKHLKSIKPELGTSCYFRTSNATEDYFISCPTKVNCYLKLYDKQSFHSTPISHLCALCESIEDEASLPVDKAKQLKAAYRAVRFANEAACYDEFRSIETFQASKINGLNLGQLGRFNNYCPNTNNSNSGSERSYKLNFLNIEYSRIESLSNNSFRQFKQLQVLRIDNCRLSSIEEDAFVHLVNLQTLVLSNNLLTRLQKSLFWNNAHLQYLDLSGNRLQTLALKAFVRLSSLRYLWLPDNDIEYLSETFAFLSNLEGLDISYNRLRNIGLQLTNLVNLTHLEIDNNIIKAVNGNAFRNLTSLNNINLAGNKIEQLHANTFKYNLKLVSIYLSGNNLTEFPPVGYLYNLQYLDVQKNRISFINKSQLFNCSRLSHLDLSSNSLISIEEDAFDSLLQLNRLTLNYNNLSIKNSIYKNSNIIIDLRLDYNNFTSFSFRNIPRRVQTLRVRFNRMRTIEAFDFSREQWDLTYVVLSNNLLVSIEHLRLPPSVQYIDFTSNNLSQIMSYEDILQQRLTRLSFIMYNDNNISVICQNRITGKGLTKQIYYDLSKNPLKCTCENMWLKNIPESNQITPIRLEYARCQHVSPYVESSSAIVHLPSLDDHHFLCQSDHTNSNRCQCPQLYDNEQCTLNCPFNCTCLSDNNLRNIYFLCNNKQFRQIPGQFEHYDGFNHTIFTFDLSNNSIPRVGPIHFGSLDTQMVAVILSNSNVTSIDDNAFDRLTCIETLDLSSNRITNLPKGLFRKLRQLTHLSLSHNHLTQLGDDAFISLTNLQYLYLHNNGLSRLHLQHILELKSLTNLTLQENQWACECTFIQFFKTALLNCSTPIHNKLTLNCRDKNGTEWNMAYYNMDICYSKTHLTIIIVSLTIGLALVIMAGLAFKWRYELQVLLYARYGLRMFHRVKEEVEDKQYDAFVAYHSKDELFLVNDLMPGLEAIANPYRLCIHHRDFPGGSYIQDSILDAIDMSCRTIVLLSESFVSSGWCRFEFKSAHMKMLQDKCPRILVILVGEVPKSLDEEMKLYLKTNTYVKWGEKLFWQKLYYAMPDKRVTAPATDIMPMRDL